MHSQYSEQPVPHSIRTPILNLLRGIQNKPPQVAQIHALLGKMYSDAIAIFCQSNNIDITSIDFVGTYTPNLGRFHAHPTDGARSPAFGWNNVINQETSHTVVFDFFIIERAVIKRNISPVAFIDGLFLRHPEKFRACISIDELINISFIPPYSKANARVTLPRDCGPGSLLIDYAMRYCTSNDQGEDNEGTFGAQGKPNQSIVDRFLDSYDYMRVKPPLTIAREMFGDHEAQRVIDECLFSNMSDADTVATVTRITAQNIVRQYRRLLENLVPPDQKVDELFICGPGARNLSIIEYLEAEIPGSVVTKSLDDVGIPSEANEAVCYAHLALEAVLEQMTQSPDDVVSVDSENSEDAIRGRIIPGKKWQEVMDKVRRFSDGKPLNMTRDILFIENMTGAIEGLVLN